LICALFLARPPKLRGDGHQNRTLRMSRVALCVGAVLWFHCGAGPRIRPASSKTRRSTSTRWLYGRGRLRPLHAAVGPPHRQNLPAIRTVVPNKHGGAAQSVSPTCFYRFPRPTRTARPIRAPSGRGNRESILCWTAAPSFDGTNSTGEHQSFAPLTKVSVCVALGRPRHYDLVTSPCMELVDLSAPGLGG